MSHPQQDQPQKPSAASDHNSNKRSGLPREFEHEILGNPDFSRLSTNLKAEQTIKAAVSYTHLTLPTTVIV